jgi:hypothetical protein
MRPSGHTGLYKTISGYGEDIISQYQDRHRRDMMDARNNNINMISVEVNDQLDLLLEYLQQDESHNIQEQDVEKISSIYQDLHQPLDLSMKKEPELDAIFSNLQNSASSSTSNSNTEHLLSSNPVSPSSKSFTSESSQSDFDLIFLPSLGSPWSERGLTPNHKMTYVIIEDPATATAIIFSITPLPSCANCFITTTSTWRKDSLGYPVCNACGLYFRVHQKKRPAEWAREGVMKRKRNNKMKRVNMGRTI